MPSSKLCGSGHNHRHSPVHQSSTGSNSLRQNPPTPGSPGNSYGAECSPHPLSSREDDMSVAASGGLFSTMWFPVSSISLGEPSKQLSHPVFSLLFLLRRWHGRGFPQTLLAEGEICSRPVPILPSRVHGSLDLSIRRATFLTRHVGRVFPST